MDDGGDRLRSGGAIILGGCFAVLPLLTGYMDGSTTLIVWAIGIAAILPVWRGAGGALSKPSAAVAYLSLVIGMLLIGWLFLDPRFLAYLGAWGGTLGLMRFITGWRDTQ